MVYARLARNWTDRGGSAHHAGELVDVDAITLAELEERGVVRTPDLDLTEAWAGPTDDDE
jgi:hypothetical protein